MIIKRLYNKLMIKMKIRIQNLLTNQIQKISKIYKCNKFNNKYHNQNKVETKKIKNKKICRQNNYNNN